MPASETAPFNGLFAAVPTPVHHDGRVNLAAFERAVDVVLTAGVDGVCVGGATGEYPHFETADRLAIIARAAGQVPSGGLLVAVGAPSIRLVRELGDAAVRAGARALLLPMPNFFRYAQDDLRAYCAEASRALAAPCLLYDLPEFTNALAAPTALSLLAEEPFVVGIKDSSGRPENLALFTAPEQRRAWTLLVGDDRLLHRGLLAGWNGGISGIAAMWPELLVRLRRSFREHRHDETARLQGLVDEIAARLARLPVPWGIRAGLAARGIDPGPMPLPVSCDRQRELREFQAWFVDWLGRGL